MTQIYDLGGTHWQYGPDFHSPFDALNVDERADVAEWLPAGGVNLLRARGEAACAGQPSRGPLWITRRPKLAYERLRDLYNPVLVGLDLPPGTLPAGRCVADRSLGGERHPEVVGFLPVAN